MLIKKNIIQVIQNLFSHDQSAAYNMILFLAGLNHYITSSVLHYQVIFSCVLETLQTTQIQIESYCSVFFPLSIH